MTKWISYIHPAGWPFIAMFFAGTFLLHFVSSFLSLCGFALSCWCIYFFRNPPRVTPLGDNLVISPADGIVVAIEKAIPPAELGWKNDPLTRISIFLNVFDVHVNRIPITGKIIKSFYYPGKFFNASLDKASEFNERNSLVIQTPQKEELLVVQIAGLIARRILCDVHVDDHVTAGEGYGIIRFGSRTDIYLPEGVNPLVIKGQRMIGGETILANLATQEPARQGRIYS